MSLVRLIARPMLASIFVVQGYKNLRDPSPLLPAASKFADRVGPVIEKAAPQAPTDPKALIRINAGAQLGAGVALGTGTLPRLASIVLAGSLVPATWMGHPFWDIEDTDQRKAQRIQFLKNVGLAGGLLLASVDTEGKPGLPWRARRAARDAKRATRTAKREAKLATRAARAEVSSRGRRLLPGRD
ncbi:MAG TPA: DoxX family protein [Jiangellaceae bacterium]